MVTDFTGRRNTGKTLGSFSTLEEGELARVGSPQALPPEPHVHVSAHPAPLN